MENIDMERIYSVRGEDIEGIINEIFDERLANRKATPIRVENYKIEHYFDRICYSEITRHYAASSDMGLFTNFDFFISSNMGGEEISYKVYDVNKVEDIGKGGRERFENMIRYGIDTDKIEEIGYKEFIKKVLDKCI